MAGDKWRALARRMMEQQQLAAGVQKKNDKKNSIPLGWQKLLFFLGLGKSVGRREQALAP